MLVLSSASAIRAIGWTCWRIGGLNHSGYSRLQMLSQCDRLTGVQRDIYGSSNSMLPASKRLRSRLMVRDITDLRQLGLAMLGRPVAAANARLNPGRADYVDLRGRTTDLVEAAYLSLGRVPVVEVAASSLRWSHLGFRACAAANPFVRTAKEYIDGQVADYAESSLRTHYEEWTPRTAGDVLGIESATQCPGVTQVAQAMVLPWRPDAGVQEETHRINRRNAVLRFESKQHGYRLDSTQGQKDFGPVSDEFGTYEFERYRKVADSILGRGFIADLGGYIPVQVLVSDEEQIALLVGGVHRAAVAVAIGIDPLPVAILARPQLVHRLDAASWPGIVSGLFDEATALEVFDRLVAGNPPASYPRDQREPPG